MPPPTDSIVAPAPTAAAAESRVRWYTVGATLLVTLTAYESLAVTTAMPTVAADLRVGGEYSLAFGITIATMIGAMAITGPLIDRIGSRTPLWVGVMLFIAGLTLAGFAPNLATLAGGRALQGIGSGMVSVVLTASVGHIVPEVLRPKVLALFSAAWVVPSLVGPAIAGAITSTIGWRWVFLSPLPLALIALAVTLRAMVRVDPRAFRSASPRPLPITAAVMAASAAAALQYTAVRVGLAELAVSAVLIVVIVGATVRLAFTGRSASSGLPLLIAANASIAGAFFAGELYLPLYLMRYHHYSAFAAGAVLTGAAVAWAAGSWLQSRVAATGPRRAQLLILGAGLVAAGVAGVALTVGFGWAPWLTLAIWAVCGAGMGIVYPSTAVALLHLGKSAEHGSNTGALRVTENAFVAVAIAVSGAIFARVTTHGHLGFATTLVAPVALGLIGVLAYLQFIRRR